MEQHITEALRSDLADTEARKPGAGIAFGHTEVADQRIDADTPSLPRSEFYVTR